MKIKSLLFGSAAALVAVSGARAADAVVIPEPEAVEYVRVCDAYGSGFFYIPGTETCLRISGYAWFQVSTASTGGTPAYYGPVNAWGVTERARLNIDARSETELGTLRAYLRYQATNTGSAVGDLPATVDQAYIDFLGFRMGYTESAWTASATGGVASWGSHSWGGMYYGYQQRDILSYNFSQNGIVGAISLENDANGNYTPDIVGVLGYTGSWGGVWGKIGYDEANFLGNSFWAGSLGVQFNVPSSPGSNLRVIGFYTDGDGAYGAGSMYGNQSEWSVLGSYNQVFSDKLSASVAAQYFNDFYATGTNVKSGVSGWGAELSVVYMPVTDFEVRGELHYDDTSVATGTTSGFLRFTRYF